MWHSSCLITAGDIMNLNHRFVNSFALTAAFSLGTLLAAQDAATPPDNTKMNASKNGQSTADQAKNNKSDVKIMAQIRRAVVTDKSLSIYGHNVKIVSKGGKVTLNGTVHTEDEKKSIEAKATAVAGDGNVTNNISVKGDSK